nr:threonine synthase [Desulfobacterales bacterium]
MQLQDFPEEIQGYLVPKVGGELVYHCLGCHMEYPVDQLLYTCPNCGSVLMMKDKEFERLKEVPGSLWRKIFDYRKMLNIDALKGIFLYHEFVAPIIPLEDIIYLGEGHTPQVMANESLRKKVGVDFYFKNDGQNPSASFKDRGMASALSYINYLVRRRGIGDILSICASTGDTSASAALYSAYLQGVVKSAVLLPHKKVTPQQLSQPLGSGAQVFEIPGVFDDCMKVVERMAETYNVALLNSKNVWRIKGQESYSYEIAQWFDYDMTNKVVVVPIGNAGNITAVIQGFLNFFDTQVIECLPKVIGVQSEHANPVYRYYLEPDVEKRVWRPVVVRPSVAQAAMIGNPVSMPRVIRLVEEYNSKAEEKKVFVVEVSEQEIMDWELTANRNGHIACTQGGESLAGLVRALKEGIVEKGEIAILDSTAHVLKFVDFQNMYFQDNFPPEFEILPKAELKNFPQLIKPESLKVVPEPGKQLSPEDFERFVALTVEDIARRLNLKPRE